MLWVFRMASVEIPEVVTARYVNVLLNCAVAVKRTQLGLLAVSCPSTAGDDFYIFSVITLLWAHRSVLREHRLSVLYHFIVLHFLRGAVSVLIHKTYSTGRISTFT
jgi:hypothetical protein